LAAVGDPLGRDASTICLATGSLMVIPYRRDASVYRIERGMK
jgi:hypothetical protein